MSHPTLNISRGPGVGGGLPLRLLNNIRLHWGLESEGRSQTARIFSPSSERQYQKLVWRSLSKVVSVLEFLNNYTVQTYLI